MNKPLSLLLIVVLMSLASAENKWQVDGYWRNMDKSTISLREQAMGGAGYATGASAGVLYTNAAQLPYIEKTELTFTHEVLSGRENIHGPFPLFIAGEGVTTFMGRQSVLWSPAGRKTNVRFALGTSWGHLHINDPIEKVVYDPQTDMLRKSGQTFNNTDMEIAFIGGIGILLPTESNRFTHSLGASLELKYNYIDNFEAPISGRSLIHRFGYHGKLTLSEDHHISVGFEAGFVANPIQNRYSIQYEQYNEGALDTVLLNVDHYGGSSGYYTHFPLRLALGGHRSLILNDTREILGITAETGLAADIYFRSSHVRGYPNPFIGIELNLVERFFLRSGLRRIKLHDRSERRELDRYVSIDDSTMVRVPYENMEIPNELEYSYGAGVKLFKILSIDFTGRVIVRSDVRKGQHQIASNLRFAW